MAAWVLSSAVSSLRRLLGDGTTDKFEFRVGGQPAPDGITTRFFVGQPRVVGASVQPFLNGAALYASGTLDADRGTLEVPTAPAVSGTLEFSYYFQWFTDAELEEFLTQAAAVVRYESVADEGLPVALRPAVLDFACYYAFMRKAAEYAETLEASAGGVSTTQKGSHPNWRSLAEAAFKNGKAKLELYAENPVGSAAPGMRFVSFELPRFQP